MFRLRFRGSMRERFRGILSPGARGNLFPRIGKMLTLDLTRFRDKVSRWLAAPWAGGWPGKPLGLLSIYQAPTNTPCLGTDFVEGK